MARRSSDTQPIQDHFDSAPPESNSNAQAGRAFLERLLGALCNQPSLVSTAETVQWLLRCFSEILPGYGLAVRLAQTPQHPALLLRLGGTASDQEPVSDATRLFPQAACEKVLALSCRPQASSFHCASDDRTLRDPGSALSQMLERCAQVLNTAVVQADLRTSVQAQQQKIEQLQRMLIQSQKLATLGQISAGVVHELTNPLTSIIAYTDYLQQKASRQGAEPDDIERLRRVGDAAHRILGFTRDLISYARPADEVPCGVDLNEVLDRALSFCKHVIEKYNVSVQVQRVASIAPVLGIAGQLTQVFVNLITNACQAMGSDGGRLQIRLVQDPFSDCIRVSLTDSGPGIAHQHIPLLFEPFFTTKTEGFGAGLGLSIVRHIVEKHHGRVLVSSTIGSGSTFSVELPFAPASDSC